MLWIIASCYACFEEQCHLWVLTALSKHHGSSFDPKQGPFCRGMWSVLSWNMVSFVLRRGPFCPETWSVLSGPFCPWSILSKYRHVHCIDASIPEHAALPSSHKKHLQKEAVVFICSGEDFNGVYQIMSYLTAARVVYLVI